MNSKYHYKKFSQDKKHTNLVNVLLLRKGRESVGLVVFSSM